MILNILKYPNSQLRKRSQEINEITPEIKRLALDMIQTMIEENGVGLAAPQVGELERLITVLTEEGPKIYIDPKISWKSSETGIGEEGCLSFPQDFFLKVKRPKSIEFSALDENGKETGGKLEGMPARVVQHEIEHLNGILIIDKIGFWQRLKLKRKLKSQ